MLPALPRTFATRLGLIALAALALRLVYTWLRRDSGVRGDALTYWLQATHLADGDGFQRAFEPEPTAEHPPLFIVLLAALRLIGIQGYNEQKFAMCAVGTVSVVLIGLLGRRIGGDRAGLVAAGLAAVYPNLFTIDGSLMSETPYALLLALTMLAAYAVLDRPSPGRLALAGALVALAALTRAEAIALLPLLILPLAWRSAPAWRGRLALAAAGTAAFVLVLTPWSVRNALTFEHPVLISNNGSGVVIGANCHRTYYGDFLGSWAFGCFANRIEGDESEFSVDYRERGLRYVGDHLDRVPLVVLARAGRMLDVLEPGRSAFFQGSEGRSAQAAAVGIRMFWVLVPLAIAGAVLLRRRGVALLPLGSCVLTAIATCLLVYGSTRLRVAAEPVVVVLAAVALDALAPRAARRLQAGRERPATGVGPAG